MKLHRKPWVDKDYSRGLLLLGINLLCDGLTSLTTLQKTLTSVTVLVDEQLELVVDDEDVEESCEDNDCEACDCVGSGCEGCGSKGCGCVGGFIGCGCGIS